jgi:hypothetical protein
MRALSIRQPFAELILRGIKRIEYRSQPTRIIGERFYIYASRKTWSGGGLRWPVRTADNIAVPDVPLPDWMIEIAQQIKLIEPGAELPTGVIVGSAVIERVTRIGGTYRWHLAGVERAKTLRKPRGHPQPVWFRS